MMGKRTFYIRVVRHFGTEEADLEIEASTRDEAEDMALAEARRNEGIL